MDDGYAGPTDRDYAAELARWQDAGATWQVVARTSRGVTVALMRCDGGEEVDRFTSADPRLVNFIKRHESSSGGNDFDH